MHYSSFAMAGIYIHIPFCKKKCHYCDFYKTLDTGLSDRFLEALKKELVLQNNYLDKSIINTIYIGGGTPSVLSAVQVREIIDTLNNNFRIDNDAEITMEANPDDIDKVYVRDIKRSGINRISLGIQSWNDEILTFLNRRHNAEQAEQALKSIFEAGIDNVSADLIYGIPGMTPGEWRENLLKTFSYDLVHLSAYHLTIEPGTVFGKMKEQGQLSEIDEGMSEKQFRTLLDISEKKGFEQYEISNFCRDGYYSIHNTNYWKREPYLGLGPSAHSFNGEQRQWNVSNLSVYLRSIENEIVPAESETLEKKDLYNEYIMTSLRTMWGVDLDHLEEITDKESRDYMNNLVVRFIKYGMVSRNENNIVLTDQGKMISDNIISELMMV